MTDPQPIPTPLNLAAAQVREAREERAQDWSMFPTPPWGDVAELSGPLLPGHLWVIGARPGNGKTTFLLNVLDHLAGSGYPVVYLCTETKASELRSIWAAMACGMSTPHVLENKWGQARVDLTADAARKLYTEALDWQAMFMVDQAQFYDLPRLDAAALVPVLEEYAVRAGYRIVMLDHVQRWNVRDPGNATGELARAVRGLKGFAAQRRITLIVAAQVNRAHDRTPLAEYLPPPLSALKQTGALEEEANVVLMLHRAKRAGVTAADLRAANEGRKNVADLVEPHTVCVSFAKHRNRPQSLGRLVRLHVGEDGRLTEKVPEWQEREAKGVEDRYEI